METSDSSQESPSSQKKQILKHYKLGMLEQYFGLLVNGFVLLLLALELFHVARAEMIVVVLLGITGPTMMILGALNCLKADVLSLSLKR